MTAERQHFSAAEVVRAALIAWAQRIMGEVAPRTVDVANTEEGQGSTLPTISLAWGSTEEIDDTADEEVYEDGRAVWRLHYEDAAFGFMFRANDPAEADYFAHYFATRAKLEAMKSNTEGNPVLHLRVTFTGGIERTVRMYLDGRVQNESGDDAHLRGLYTYRVPGSVTYPVMAVEDHDNATGVMTVVLVINGHEVRLVDIEAAEAAAQEES